MSIATKTGDAGGSLADVSRASGSKADAARRRVWMRGRIERRAGLARVTATIHSSTEQIYAAQKELVIVMGELATGRKIWIAT